MSRTNNARICTVRGGLGKGWEGAAGLYQHNAERGTAQSWPPLPAPAPGPAVPPFMTVLRGAAKPWVCKPVLPTNLAITRPDNQFQHKQVVIQSFYQPVLQLVQRKIIDRIAYL